MAQVTCGYFWAYPYLYLCLPVPATRRSQVTGHGGYGSCQGLGQYFYLIIYLMTIIKPPYEQVLVGMGVDCGWAQRNERKKKETAQETCVPWARENKTKQKNKNTQETSVSWAYPLVAHHFPSSPSPLVIGGDVPPSSPRRSSSSHPHHCRPLVILLPSPHCCCCHQQF